MSVKIINGYDIELYITYLINKKSALACERPSERRHTLFISHIAQSTPFSLSLIQLNLSLTDPHGAVTTLSNDDDLHT